MKRVALLLLVAAAALYVLATVMAPRHVAWGYVAAFAEAAMVGAIADWFAVVALFRRPMGLPIPHTAVIPNRKDRIGHQLAQFVATHFLATELVMTRLRDFDVAARGADWLSRPESASRLANHVADAGVLLVPMLSDARVLPVITDLARAGLRQVDVTRLSGQLLQALTQEGRHQQLLDGVLGQLARLLGEDAVQDGISEAIAREVKALRYVGLDQVAARLATRKVVIIIARTLLEMAEDPRHPLRQRFDDFAADWSRRLQEDDVVRQRGERLRDELLASAEFAVHVEEFWARTLAWLDAELQHDESWTRQHIAAAVQALGVRLGGDGALRAAINDALHAAVPTLLQRYRGAVADWIEVRVQAWDARELSDELERHVGRDLQFIRVNGTLVGGLVGLLIHAATHWWG